MASQYSSFLQSPNATLLAADASLFYVTTTTEIKEATGILKHLQAQHKQVEKKSEKILSSVESQNGLALEVETTLEFKNGGGAYLPGVDENLLDEKTVVVPMTHFVSFNAEHKIKQIRLYWDQGTVLKQVEAIGKTGRNWPIRDGPAQISAVNKSLKAAGPGPAPGSNGNGTASAGPPRGANDVVISQHKKRESVNATNDPHASLALFAARDPNEEANSRSYNGPSLAPPRTSAKPAPRDFVDIAGDDLPPAAGSTVRSPSPTKADGVHLKSGAGKHYATNRLFDENESPPQSRSPERKKTYGGKYNHFTFGDGEDAPDQARPSSKRSDKNNTTFSFEDFATPPKHVEKPRPDYERHWGAGVQDDDPPSPAKRPVVHAARHDAESHFEFTDQASPARKDPKPKSFQRQKGMGLYQDPLDDDSHDFDRQPGMNSTRRGDDFGATYTLSDASPAAQKVKSISAEPKQQQPLQSQQPTQTKNPKSASVKGRSDNDSNWAFPTSTEKKIYKTAGDGMGGRKGAGRSWGFGDESDPEHEADVRPSARRNGGNGRGGRLAQAEAGADYPDF